MLQIVNVLVELYEFDFFRYSSRGVTLEIQTYSIYCTVLELVLLDMKRFECNYDSFCYLRD